MSGKEKGPGTCGAHHCNDAATLRVHWPGKTLEMCELDAERAKGIASAMGFELAIDPISRPVIVGNA